MTVANFNNHEDAVSAYNALVELRHVREVSKKGEANKLRRKSPEGNIWSSANYRPTYTQESVSDLSTVVDELKLGNTKIYWEDLWRKGDDSYWNGELVEHRELGRFSPRVESSVLRRLREQTKEEAKSKAGSQEVQAEESPAV